ncbi:resolvase [Pasteurella multocida]|uniref:recombinase family protein n=1 Tax=Pasteurella multocida TaxID=747 RepID=UPI001093E0BA|nr:recombinase family protein [Pasteurella multocida]NAT88815.1 resolvase [Pasteurella multocida]QCA35437.1 resolvase [Pasteurella multocida]HDX1107990.1 recombinase family protein [Pasteurella multocida]HDX1131609.1 recombinase family protein [Pasteurella multocida]HDX1150391.1 recombinase family protein [Pasteurella multocida]
MFARIYMRVSTEEQDLQRQDKLIEDAKQKGFYVVAVYREKISGTTEWEKRPELARLIGDLQQNDVVIAESIDRLTRLEPKKALELIDAIQSKGAKIQVPEVFDMNTLSQSIGGQASVFDPHFLMSDLFSALQNMFFKLAVNVAYNDYQKRKERQHQGIALARKQRKYRGRQPNIELHNAIIEQRKNGTTIKKTAAILNTSESTVLRVWRKYKT